MALFKTTDEITKFLPVIGTTEYNSMLPFINQAERDYIIPNISQAQYDDQNNAYNAATPALSPAQTALLNKCQAALSQYFFYLWIPTAQLSIGDNGIRIATTETLKTAFQWQINELQRSVLRAAGSAMDALLAFMEANKSDYSSWSGSSSYTEYKDAFIISTSKFTELFSPLGNSRLNFLAIRSALKKEQELTIQSEIGEEYYEELKTQHKNNNVSTANAKAIALIQKALAPLTMLRAFTELSVTIDERGILNFDSTGNRESINAQLPAKDQMISKLERIAEADAKAYLKKLKDFLKANIADYPTYAASTAYNSETTDTSYKNNSTDTIFFAG